MRRPLPRRQLARIRRRPVPPEVRPTPRQLLTHAHRLLTDEQFGEAARIFTKLSNGADRHSMPVRAGELALRGAHAYIKAGEVPIGLDWAKKGLRHLTRADRPRRVAQGLFRTVELLREIGYDTEAIQFERDVKNALADVGFSLDEAATTVMPRQSRTGTLPAKCSGCGAPLHPNEVEWYDTQTAGCVYCGTLAKVN